jgi:probable addiction module antidote protein
MTLETHLFDSADFLDSDEAIAAYLEEAFDSQDPRFMAHALGVVARAHGMSQIARDTGLSRESLYRALSSEGNPEFTTVVRVMKSLGLKLTAAPLQPAQSQAPRRRARKSA